MSCHGQLCCGCLCGPPGENGRNGKDGATGPRGPEGPQGKTGADGEKGETGPKGRTGATGPAGSLGHKGHTGDTGETGERGPVGERGPAGERGPDGPPGEAGPLGPRGVTGASGPRGETGPTGEVGPRSPGVFDQTTELEIVFPNPPTPLVFQSLIGQGVGAASISGFPPLTINDIGVGATYLYNLGAEVMFGNLPLPVRCRLFIGFNAGMDSLAIEFSVSPFTLTTGDWSLDVLFTFVGAGKVNVDIQSFQPGILITWNTSGTNGLLVSGPVEIDLQATSTKAPAGIGAMGRIVTKTGVLTKQF